MAQVIASHYDGIDILASLMARLKQHMLEYYAQKLDLQPKLEWCDRVDHIVVECNEQQVLNLLSILHSNGCTDLHVYSEDETTRRMVEEGLYGQFRVCQGKWSV